MQPFPVRWKNKLAACS